MQPTAETPAISPPLGAVDRAYQWMRDAIMMGHLPAGSQMNERELSVKIGVSRTPVREALRRLEMQGLVKPRFNGFSTVVSWTDRDIDEVFELRMLLEGLVVQYAAVRSGVEHLDGLDEQCSRMEAAFADPTIDRPTRLERASLENSRFHGLLLDAAGSDRLRLMLSHISSYPFVFRTYQWFSDAEVQRSMGHHREIVAALRAGDAEWATTCIRSHILASRANLRAHTAVSGPSKAGRGAAPRDADAAITRRRRPGA